MKSLFAVVLLFLSTLVWSQVTEIKTLKDEKGWRLQADGVDLPIKGVVWSYTPIGENYNYDLWAQPEDYITRVIDTDMTLIKAMGANAIRVFSQVPPQWVEYIFDRYGIYTMVYEDFGRYGVTVDGRWQMPTDYSDPATRRTLLAKAKKTFERFKDTRGVLMYMLGNESNYGLDWTSAATENLPGGERNEFKAKALYSLFEEAFVLGKGIDPRRPMGLCNGDLQYLRVMKDLVPDLDILGVNTYRGAQSYAAFYNSIAKDLDRPFLYTELGADAYNVATEQEDQDAQAKLLKSQWREIYDQSWGKGKSANALGGFVFEWMDEWWKAGMETGLTVHDTQGTWNNGGYAFDAIPGRNNMNEEWFGIVGMSTHTLDGVARRLPRTAYFLLQDLWRLDLYTSTKDGIAKKFDNVNEAAASVAGHALQAGDGTTNPLPAFVPRGSVTVRSYWDTLDKNWVTDGTTSLVNQTQTTVLTGGEFRTGEGLTGSFRIRLLPEKPLFVENWSMVDPVESAAKSDWVDANDHSKGKKYAGSNLELYQATVDYQSRALTATLHYHDGHTDWVTEGDLFGLLPEAYDLMHMDKGGNKAPFGVEVTLPDLVPGLKVYAGPELFWGAQPRILAKYSRTFGTLTVNALHDEEYGTRKDVESASVANLTNDRWSAFSVDWAPSKGWRGELGALLGQYNRVNKENHFYRTLENGALSDAKTFTWMDALEAKAKVTADAIPYLHLVVQGIYAGPLAETREMMPREGSQLSDVGAGNRLEVQGTVQALYGDWVLRTTVLSRKPLVAPLVGSGQTGRSPIDDEFYVWRNREALQAEGVLTWDPTGGTYFHNWDNVDAENAPLAASLGLLYNLRLGATDKFRFISDTNSLLAFSTGLPAVDGTWSAKARVAGRPLAGVKLALEATAGRLQSTGGDSVATTDPSRLTSFWTVAGKAAWDRVMVEGSWAKDNWGPYGWQREWNYGFPIQWTAGLAYGLKPISFLTDTDRIGIRAYGRTFGDYSFGTATTFGADKTPIADVKSQFTAELYAGWSF